MNVPTMRRYSCAQKTVRFIENKPLDMALVGTLLDECRAVNHWANFGPLYRRLADEYSTHMNIGAGQSLTPCANAGIALEALARLSAAEVGKEKLRWVGSAFSFKNLGRGYFADIEFIDCDTQGVLDLSLLEQVPLDRFDGFIVTNPFGMNRDFERFITFAKATGKKLLIDNAAGVDRVIPNWPWQAFSLHHTKPYGFGEGGLALTPESAAEALEHLINYDKAPDRPAHWLNNGKISDVACAFLIARLRGVSDWENGYREQRERVHDLFVASGATSMLASKNAPLTTCLPILLEGLVCDQKLEKSRSVDIARQYEPLAPLPQVQKLYSRLINYPTHPDLAGLSDDEIIQDIETLY